VRQWCWESVAYVRYCLPTSEWDDGTGQVRVTPFPQLAAAMAAMQNGACQGQGK